MGEKVGNQSWYGGSPVPRAPAVCKEAASARRNWCLEQRMVDAAAKDTENVGNSLYGKEGMKDGNGAT